MEKSFSTSVGQMYGELAQVYRTGEAFEYAVGAGALIPYKRGDDDVGWFICYRHS